MPTSSTDAIKQLTGLAAQFNDSATNPQSVAKLSAALATFVEQQKAEQLQGDLELVMGWVKTVQLLLKRAAELQAANKDGARGPAAAAKGNIQEAIVILSRLNDPKFAASRKKKPTQTPSP